LLENIHFCKVITKRKKERKRERKKERKKEEKKGKKLLSLRVVPPSRPTAGMKRGYANYCTTSAVTRTLIFIKYLNGRLLIAAQLKYSRVFFLE